MVWFDRFSQQDDYQQSPHAALYDNREKEHKSEWTHELVGGAAGAEAMRLYEQREEAEGQAPDHQVAKEILAGLAGAEVDKLFETKGLDYIDRERAKHRAKEQARQLYDQHYGQSDY
ncbi:hypothetical protein KFL_001190120 [Klebsormidium nitens]|uniref:CipC-like antibiotic response protein n=1 Tax=Klebsormidium nitens TaxID=105231 RepID=A0A0U9HJK9_KLENI|nr:hypothetical protein KFL_001190120 [Klebsormidium nitens]|eukprot:GAQ82669.1 hypothetical protein KFL_001190120 [Klebsormidium nitens]